MSTRNKIFAALAVVLLLFAVVTAASIQPVAVSFQELLQDRDNLQMTDRMGRPLTVSYQNRWNTYDNIPLHDIPQLLQNAFVASEDKRFFDHGGVDWRSRSSALWQNIKSARRVRGASTISEQVVRLMHPRSRTLWSKWIETFEAANLESRFSKQDILEFYLNQIPYASNRRGVAQAARYYFNRDLSTLTSKEMLALAVLARAPSGYDLYKDAAKIDGAIDRLAASIGLPPQTQVFALEKPQAPVNAEHFAQYVRARSGGQVHDIRTTLDADLQKSVQGIIDQRVKALEKKNVHNAAVLVADHTTGQLLAWVVAGAGSEKTPAGKMDAVTIARQPGSALKPFLYALAIDGGWTAVTILDDDPLSEAVGTGLHKFKNYSNFFYGRMPLREALGNSLNIPALLTVQHVGAAKYLGVLRQLGFSSLDKSADIYDDGLALGVGEVTLFEMVQGYAALANKGVYRPLTFLADDAQSRPMTVIYKPETASLMGNILSDPFARRLEFGNNSVLNLPVQTAAKTGTSTDYRDAWAMGYNDRYVVGIWMGNLNRAPTDGVTGSTGPALALRSVFGELNKNRNSHPLWLSPKLVKQDICIEDPRDASRCYMRSEYFADGMQPQTGLKKKLELVKPTDGLQMAIDPRIPLDYQKFEFAVKGLTEDQQIEWTLNGAPLATTGDKFLWPLKRGQYTLQAKVVEQGKAVAFLPEAHYVVK